MKIFLAATQLLLGDASETVIPESKYLLEAFYGIRAGIIPYLQNCQMHLIDSGAFTFMNTNKHKVVDFDSYTDAYIDFINTNGFKNFFEMDVDSIVGYGKVLKLRERIERRTGKQVIPVWHYSRKKNEFIAMCRDYPYVAFGGIMTDGVDFKTISKYLPWFIDTAHEHGAQIHGLGFTHPSLLPKYHFDSVDSTTWISTPKYGQLRIFDGEKMVVVKRPSPKARLAWNHRDAAVFSFREFCKLQRYAEYKL